MGEKKLLNSEQEYFDYCICEGIGGIYRKYSSTSCYLDEESSIACDEGGQLMNEYVHITRKPKRYPCIFTWHCEEGDHDIYSGFFVYEDDFKKE